MKLSERLALHADAWDDWNSEHPPEDRAVEMPALLREAAAALEAAREDGWQPIETAPRDGRPILLYQPTEGGMYLPDFERCADDYTFTGFYSTFYKCWFCWEYDAFPKEPTHWMPLAEPPK